MKYRSKPVVIEAVRFDGTESAYEMVMAWGESFLRVHGFDGTHMFIETLEGQRTAHQGDWIIRGTIGEFYPVKDEVFRVKYEKVGE